MNCEPSLLHAERNPAGFPGTSQEKQRSFDFEAESIKLCGVPQNRVCRDPCGKPVLAVSLQGVLWIDTLNLVTAPTSFVHVF